MKDSIIPILTKCKPGDDDLDIDQCKNVVNTIMIEEIKKSLKLTDQQIADDPSNEYKSFIDTFTESLLIFDPLDRPIPS